MPVITNEEPNVIQTYQWGLIPYWTKDAAYSKVISKQTCNAKAETIDTLNSFKEPFKKRRCLVIADGFFEWRHEDKDTKIPYYISLKDDELFAFVEKPEALTT